MNSATALGTSLFTINNATVGTSLLDNTSSGAVTISPAVPINWNGAFAFIGSNSLNLGSGAVAMGGAAASTRTVTVKANNLQIDGPITDAGNLDNFVKQGAGTLTLTNPANSWGGTTSINGGTVALGSTGTLGTATTALNLGNGELSISGAQSVSLPAITDNTGTDTITLTPISGALTVTAASLAARSTGSTMLYRGTNLGSTPGSGVATILFSTPPALTTGATGPWGSLAASGTGTLGTTQAAVLKGALVDTSASGSGIGFATYDPTDGVRLLNPLTEQNSVTTTTGFAATNNGDNVLISNPGSALSLTGKPVNTLQINNTTTGTSPLAITLSGTLDPSNGLLFTGSSPITVTGGTDIVVADSSTTAQDFDILSTDTGSVTISSIMNESGASSNVGAITFGGPGNITLSGGSLVTKSNGGAFFNGSGTVTLAEAVNMSSGGLNIDDGTVILASGFSYSTARPFHLAAGATLNLNGISPGNVDYLVDVNGAGGTITNTNATTSTLTIENSSSTNNSTQTFSGAITGNINLVLQVSGSNVITQVLAGQSTYTGTTTIGNNTLKLGINNALPVGTALTVNGATSGITSVLDLGGFNQTVGSLAGTLTAGPSATILNSAVSTISTLTVNGSANSEYDGVIEDNAGTGGTVALAKSGASTLTLTGVNLYSGGTTVRGGTLVASGSSPTGIGLVTIANGGILAGTGTIAGAVTVNPGGHIAPGVGGIGTLNLGSGSCAESQRRFGAGL